MVTLSKRREILRMMLALLYGIRRLLHTFTIVFPPVIPKVHPKMTSIIRSRKESLFQGVWYFLYFLYFLYRRKKFLYSYIGGPKGTKPPIFGPLLTQLFKMISETFKKKKNN